MSEKVRKLTELAVLTAVSLIIFVIELQIPNPFPIPGIKLGLANIITVYAVYHYKAHEVAAMVAVRLLLGAVFSGNFMALIYSASGAFLCLVGMLLLRRFIDERHLWIASVLGAVLHNTGQMAAALIITGTPELLWYMPPLIISAVITGTFNGICTRLVYKHMFFNKKGLPH